MSQATPDNNRLLQDDQALDTESTEDNTPTSNDALAQYVDFGTDVSELFSPEQIERARSLAQDQ